MTIWEHLEELRARLLRAVIAVLVAFVVMLFFTSDIIEYLSDPYTDITGRPLQQLEPTGNIVIYFRVALLGAGIVVIPYITYQLFMFVSPGLTRRERRWILSALPFTTGFFLLGVAFSWFIMIPAAFEFLIGFQNDVLANEWTAQRYFAFLTSIIFWVGVSFEMPVVLYVLARMGLVGRQALINNWRFAVVAMSVVAALVTPTVDPFNMLLVMAPLLILYMISIVLVGIAENRLRRALDSQDT